MLHTGLFTITRNMMAHIGHGLRQRTRECRHGHCFHVGSRGARRSRGPDGSCMTIADSIYGAVATTHGPARGGGDFDYKRVHQTLSRAQRFRAEADHGDHGAPRAAPEPSPWRARPLAQSIAAGDSRGAGGPAAGAGAGRTAEPEGAAGVVALVGAVAECSRLRALDLRASSLTHSAACELALLVGGERCQLVSLSLADCFLGEAAVPVLGAVQTNRGLVKLNLRLNALSDREGIPLCNALRESISLTDVDLASNDLSDDFGMNFARVLCTNDILWRVDLARNPLGSTAGDAILEVLKRRKVGLVSIGDTTNSLFGLGLQNRRQIQRFLDENSNAFGGPLNTGEEEEVNGLCLGDFEWSILEDLPRRREEAAAAERAEAAAAEAAEAEGLAREERRKEKEAEKKRRQKEKLRAKKDEQRAEQARQQAERDLQAAKAAAPVRCAMCGEGLLGQAFEAMGESFCSTACVRCAAQESCCCPDVLDLCGRLLRRVKSCGREDEREKYERTIRFLASVPLFKMRLPPSELPLVAQALREKCWRSGSRLVKQGDMGSSFFLVCSGHASVLHVDEDGHEHESAVLGPGDWLGGHTLVAERPNNMTVRARG
ncbi:unnamed protein product, partial [Prorocentrum cordatum]